MKHLNFQLAKLIVLILALLAVSCNTTSEVDTAIEGESILPLVDVPEQPPVEYGASLEEWDAAVQAEALAANVGGNTTDVAASELMSTEAVSSETEAPTTDAEELESPNQGLQLTTDGRNCLSGVVLGSIGSGRILTRSDHGKI